MKKYVVRNTQVGRYRKIHKMYSGERLEGWKVGRLC